MDVVVIHRRQLPIANPCEGFEPAPGSVSGGGGFCTRCSKQVHDVSAMRESELRRFLAERTTPTVCLAYRVDARGVIQLRPEPRTRVLALAAMVALLAACAGHGRELEVPGSACVDASGYEVVCDEFSEAEMVSVPEGGIASSTVRAPSSEGCPIRPTARPPESSTIEPGGGAPEADTGPSVEGEPGPVAESGSTAAKVRVDFSIEPEQDFIRGMVVVGVYEERDFVPTKELWTEAKERRAQRRRHRRRWRDRNSSVSSR